MTSAKTRSKKYKNIPVSEEVYQQVVEYKKRMGYKTFNDAVLGLLKEHRELMRYRVHQVLCTKYREASASLTAWITLLEEKEGFNKYELSIAWEYLTLDESSKDILRVNKEKCEEFTVLNVKELLL